MSTYTPIFSTTLTSNTATVAFTNIPQFYRDLVIVAQMKNNGTGSDFLATFNGDGSTNYSRTIIGGNGTSTYSALANNSSSLRFNYSEPITTDGNTIYRIEIMNYASSSTFKTVINRADRGATSTAAIVNMWRSTSAITNITFSTDASGQFVAGSVISIYGITNGVKAAGGNSITTDGTYVYHTFTSSGTFTPITSISNVDYLVVAGGAGGNIGGGGAGGLRCTVGATGGGGTLESKLTLAPIAYTVTIGAGGASAADGNNSVFGSITSNKGGSGAGPNGSGTGGAVTSGSAGAFVAGAAGTAGQGYAGGTSTKFGTTSPTYWGAGGGGGAGAVGDVGRSDSNPATSFGGNGGVGIQTSISGTATYYAGGGGGYNEGNTTRATGGSGGGGNADNSTNSGGTAATANTGGGGGGRGSGGYAGGSGIVIIRYAI